MIPLKQLAIAGAVGAAITISQGVFVVNQGEQAIILQLGEFQRKISDPGLNFKIPLIQTAIFFDKRILDFDMSEVTITTSDKKQIKVDTYTRYRIEDPLTFYKNVRPADELGLRPQLEPIVDSAVRNILGKKNLTDLLTEERSKIMHQINEDVQKSAKPLGIEIIDVRIKRTELPESNRKSIFGKMNSEQERIAKENRAEGAEKAQKIKSTAEKERTVLIAEAHRDGQKNRGEGEAKALQLVSETLGRDPEFYGFYRSMETYKATLTEGTTMMLSTDSELFKYFSHPEKLIKSGG